MPLHRTHRRATALLVATVALAGCGGDGDDTTADETTATSATTTTTATSTTTTSLPGGDLVRCESPEGFAVAHPAAWQVNERCTRFSPEPFDDPGATDERVAAITAYVDPVPFADATAPRPERDEERAATTVSGLQAVRLAYEASGDALWPDGTPITLYAVDLAPEPGDEPRTLFLDTIGTAPFDHGTDEVVLDRMARTLEVTLDGIATDPAVVSRTGGAGGSTVTAEVDGDQVCLRIPPEGEPACVARPAAGEVATVELDDLGPVLAGVAGPDVFRVTAERSDGSEPAVLPVPVGGEGPPADGAVGGFAFGFGADEVEALRLADVTGAGLGTAEPGG